MEFQQRLHLVLSCLRNGSKTARDIANSTGLTTSNVYSRLEAYRHYGYIFKRKPNKKQYIWNLLSYNAPDCNTSFCSSNCLAVYINMEWIPLCICFNTQSPCSTNYSSPGKPGWQRIRGMECPNGGSFDYYHTAATYLYIFREIFYQGIACWFGKRLKYVLIKIDLYPGNILKIRLKIW